MRKYILALAAVFLLPMQSNAQFLKKLGKALGKVASTVLEQSTTNSSSTQNTSTLRVKKSTASCGATIKNAIPNIKVDVMGAGQVDDGIFVVMTLTNTSRDTQSFVFVGVKGSELSTTPADYGKPSSNWKLGNHDWYHFGQEFNGSCWDYQIGAGEKIDAWLLLKGINSDITMINNMRLSARLGGTSYYVGQDEQIYYVDVSNLTVKPLQTYSSSTTSTNSSSLSIFVSNDLRLNDLRGNVEVVYGYYDENNEYDGYEYSFSQSGTWTNIGPQTLKQRYNNAAERDASGRIKRLCSEDMGSVEDINYTYNVQGFVTKKSIDYGMDGSSVVQFTYDANGDVVKKVSIDGDGSGKTTETYTILERDSHGNWTRRKIVSSDGSSRVEKRRINYYQ